VVGFDADLTIRREIDRVLHLHDVEVRVVMEFDNVETIKRAIEIDAGIGLLPQPTVLREVEAGTLAAVPLATDELVRPLGIIHRRGKDLGVTVRRFIDLLCSEGKDLVGSALVGKDTDDKDTEDVVGSSAIVPLAPAASAAAAEPGKIAEGNGKSNGAGPGRSRQLAVAQTGS
jgi:hypothetical protein